MTVRTNRKGSAKVAVVSDTAYTIEREFGGSAAAVFRAMTEPEYVKRWWGCPDSEWLDCQADVRPGGYWRNSMRDGGQEVSFHGWYQEVDRPHRSVHTEVYEGVTGGGPESTEPSTLITTELTEQGGVTTLKAHVECHTPEILGMILESGMESGIQVAYDRLDDLLPEAEG